MTTRTVPAPVWAVVLLVGLCSACGETQFEYNQQLNYTASLRLQNAEPTGNDRTVVLAEGVDFELTTMTPELVQYKGRFKELQIQKLSYTIRDNTLNADIDAIEVALGPLGAADPSAADAVLIATIDSLPAGTDGAGDAEIHHENTSAASPLVFDLDFGVAQGTEFQVQAGAQPPTGGLTLDVELFLTLIADPI